MGEVEARKSNYSVKEMIQNGIYLIRTKLFYNSCRLIRFPISVRGRKYIDFGKGLTTGRYCRIEVNGKFTDKRLILGKNVILFLKMCVPSMNCWHYRSGLRWHVCCASRRHIWILRKRPGLPQQRSAV